MRDALGSEGRGGAGGSLQAQWWAHVCSPLSRVVSSRLTLLALACTLQMPGRLSGCQAVCREWGGSLWVDVVGSQIPENRGVLLFVLGLVRAREPASFCQLPSIKLPLIWTTTLSFPFWETVGPGLGCLTRQGGDLRRAQPGPFLGQFWGALKRGTGGRVCPHLITREYSEVWGNNWCPPAHSHDPCAAP